MLQTPRSTRGMVVAPHHLAAEAGLRVLREGGFRTGWWTPLPVSLVWSVAAHNAAASNP